MTESMLGFETNGGVEFGQVPRRGRGQVSISRSGFYFGMGSGLSFETGVRVDFKDRGYGRVSGQMIGWSGFNTGWVTFREGNRGQGRGRDEGQDKF